MSRVTLRDAARHCRVSKSTIHRRVDSGELPAVRVGDHYEVEIADLDALFGPTPVIPRNPHLPDDIREWAESVAATAPPMSTRTALAVAGILRGAAA